MFTVDWETGLPPLTHLYRAFLMIIRVGWTGLAHRLFFVLSLVQKMKSEASYLPFGRTHSVRSDAVDHKLQQPAFVAILVPYVDNYSMSDCSEIVLLTLLPICVR
jgi:hypothetical protein